MLPTRNVSVTITELLANAHLVSKEIHSVAVNASSVNQTTTVPTPGCVSNNAASILVQALRILYAHRTQSAAPKTTEHFVSAHHIYQKATHCLIAKHQGGLKANQNVNSTPIVQVNWLVSQIHVLTLAKNWHLATSQHSVPYWTQYQYAP